MFRGVVLEVIPIPIGLNKGYLVSLPSFDCTSMRKKTTSHMEVARELTY